MDLSVGIIGIRLSEKQIAVRNAIVLDGLLCLLIPSIGKCG